MKNREQLAEELAIKCNNESERKISDEKYALKVLFNIVKNIVFALVALITTTAIIGILRLIWK